MGFNLSLFTRKISKSGTHKHIGFVFNCGFRDKTSLQKEKHAYKFRDKNKPQKGLEDDTYPHLCIPLSFSIHYGPRIKFYKN